MDLASTSALIALALILGMLLAMELGRRIARRRLALDPDGANAGVGVVDGAIFALLGLLIAFTFSGAGARFDLRRQQIVEETNAIGTAYLRLDLLPADTRSALQESFRRYIDLRLAVYRKLPDVEAAKAESAKATAVQEQIWSRAVDACKAQNSAPVTMLLLPALNQMIDIATTRTMTAQMHPPKIVFVMLIMLALASALLAGYDLGQGKTRNWIHMVGLAAIMGITIYVILDIEYPRAGFIRIDAFDQALIDLRQSMK